MQMSYLKIEYEIVPTESFCVIRGCSGCGRKTHFRNTQKFRVNANGNRVDVWLIYQCEHCKHTLNLAVYERQKVSSVPKAEYEAFLSNDAQLAQQYGKTLSLFQKNKAAVDFEQMNYSYVKLHETTQDSGSDKSMELTIHNPCGLKIRPEKQIADVLGLSRSQVKKRMAQGEILVDETDFGKLHFYSPHCIM
jgi:hypothetical protein